MLILLSIVVLAIAGFYIGQLSKTLSDLYDQPFVISTGVLRIDSNIGSINQDIGKILVSTSFDIIESLQTKINEQNVLIKEDFAIIRNRISREDLDLLQQSEQLYDEWFVI